MPGHEMFDFTFLLTAALAKAIKHAHLLLALIK